MRELALLTFITLDGVMQAPSDPSEDTSGDFQHGGWAAPWWDEVMAQVGEVAMAKPYDLLLGRKTYELFAPHWSSATNEDGLATLLNSATKYVVTNTLNNLTWQNSIAVQGDAPLEIKTLKAQEGPLLQVHGSANLIQTLLRHDLIDEIRLWTFPIVVGGGKRLFESMSPIRRLTLKETAQTENGAIMSIYRRQPSI